MAGKLFTEGLKFMASPEGKALRAKGWDVLCGIGKKGKEALYKKGEIIRDNSGKVQFDAAGKISKTESTGILATMGRNKIATGIVGAVGYHEVTGNSLADIGAGGVVEYISEVIGGDKNVVKSVGNVTIGKENTEKVADAAEKGLNAAVETVKGAADTMTNGWANIKNFFGSIFGLNPGAANGAVSGVGGFSQAVSNILGTGVNFNLPNIAMTMAAAWLTFGNFGFTGKIAGALLGALGLKNMFGGPALTPAIAGGQAQQQVRGEDQSASIETNVNTGRAVVPQVQAIGNDEIAGPDYDNGENPEETTRRGFRR